MKFIFSFLILVLVGIADCTTPLHEAAQQGDVKRVQSILIEHPERVTATDDDNWTPFHFAAWEGHTDIVNILIKHYANVMATDNDGWTPLHYATLNGHEDIVKILNSSLSPF